MQSSDIRTTFLDFFTGKGHLVMPSFSLVPQDDPTLLLIGAGMAPLKPYFTGERKPPHSRIATCQKCVRANDIEQVGFTGRHATFFEMLGNFSFGDYFKEEAITWSWELVRNIFRLPGERLWISIYEDDDEAYQIWHEQIGIPAERIVRLGREDNFWEIGTGPCGPCSEIYYDLGPELGCGNDSCLPGCDCDRYLEIWNLVFTQFNREPDGSLTTLEQKNIDTGAGLERLATALQGVNTFYDTDLFRPLCKHFAALAGEAGGEDPDRTALRIIAEHARGVTFLTADGILPSNEGRGYILRRLIRRALRYGRLIGIEDSFLAGAVPLLVRMMGEVYPELEERREFITRVIEAEESRFQETLAGGLEILEEHLLELAAEKKEVFPGELAFKLYDTYGFPLDLTAEILREQGFTLDRGAFERSLEQQRQRARAARSRAEDGAKSSGYELAGTLETVFTGYDRLEERSQIRLLLVDGEPREKAVQGESVEIVLDRTPFYAEAGGQVGDSGLITGAGGEAAISRTIFTPAGQIVHQGKVEQGSLAQDEDVTARVEELRRRGICRSHTATHLLHRALRDLLGEHAAQSGSLVNNDRLRFDFVHFDALTPEEMARLEEDVNRKIIENLPLTAEKMTLPEARRSGAVALFDEKYTQEAVRVISAGSYSKELCGGTHVAATGEIGSFRIIAEEGIGSGLRRIEACTGLESHRRAAEDRSLIDTLALQLKTAPEQLAGKLAEVLEENRRLTRHGEKLKEKLHEYAIQDLLARVEEAGGAHLLSAAVDAEDFDELRRIADHLKDRFPSLAAVLGAVHGGKVLLVSSVSGDLVERGLRADEIVKKVARRVGGGGGGRATMAQAGGRDTAALPGALQWAAGMLRRLATDENGD
ncbi:MAG: alanine--tRNA ligase [Dethiobacteria bacterium]|jgi:alanyl-tRNA synthetase